ncbi:hypothetical protein ACFPYI_06170 [Halomarina salina]|uniref:Uncharacterized protein n=1 Tax=Halomarina salina TaxID=1872699 RepID=A0ABD5RKK6_9EURY|nr:hypothetical protein [Halomarina salina]
MRTDDTSATASTGPAAGATALLHVLVEFRYVVYLGGLAAIAAPTLLEYADVSVPLSARRLVVGIVLAVMAVTYLGERRFVHGGGGRSDAGDHDDGARTDSDRRDDGERSGERGANQFGDSFDWRTRLALVGAIAGIALGVYVAVAVDLLYGVVFVVGAYLFAQLAVQSRGENGG